MTTIQFALALLLAVPRVPAASSGFADEVRVGAPIAKGNLSVFPLKLRSAGGAAAEPATLDEAVARKQLAIQESGTGDVNALEVENRGDRAVLLLAGELVLGGKQDRIIGRSMVLAPRSRTRVPVFCVEHGRWNGGKAFESGGAMGHAELRKVALSGDQSRVWAEVKRANERLGTTNASDTYRAAARKLGGEVGPLASELAEALARDAEVAGLAVAIDGEVVAVEWFSSPRVFARIREKLVASYVAQALEPREGRAQGVHPAAAATAQTVADFAAKAERGGAVVERVRSGSPAAPTAAPPVQTTYLRR
jgi:hypothetical protein